MKKKTLNQLHHSSRIIALVLMGMLAVAAAQGPPQKVSAEEASASSSSGEEASSSNKEAEAKEQQQPAGEMVPDAPFIFIPKADDPMQATRMVTAMLGEQMNQVAAMADKVGKRKRERIVFSSFSG